MCDFHSTAWRLLGQEVQMCHLSNNSHADMIKAAGWRENQPNRQVMVFEAEWDGEGSMRPDGSLVRNSAECPEKVMVAIRRHYQKLKESISDGKHLNAYFGDHKKFSDVWSRAMRKGHMPDFSDVTEFSGYVIVAQGATLTAPGLIEVSGYVRVEQGATLTAPKLKR